MVQDEIIAEVRQNREALSAEYDHDIRKLARALSEKEATQAAPTVDRKPRPYLPPKVAEAG